MEKKSKQEKFVEIQRNLEKEKQESMWKILIGTILFPVPVILFTHNVLDLIIYSTLLFLAWLLFFLDRVKGMNMSRIEKELREKIKIEEESLVGLKTDYGLLCNMSFNLIPQKLNKTALYLLSQKDKTPEEVIEDRNEEVWDMGLQLVCYQGCIERTFWQYLRSWKWLKKIK